MQCLHEDIAAIMSWPPRLPDYVVALQICDYSCSQVDKDGKEVRDLKLKDVVIGENTKFNLFRVTKRQLDGWTLGGDDKAIVNSNNCSRTT